MGEEGWGDEGQRTGYASADKVESGCVWDRTNLSASWEPARPG